MTDYAPELQTVLDREPAPPAGTTGADVDYEIDGAAFRGYAARPAQADGPLPAVLVVHDWLGVTDSVRMRCDMLARLGYAAFAADMYGAEVTATQQTAPQLAGALYGDQGTWRQRVTAAHARMVAEDGVDADRTAVIGYCFGGSTALQLARTGTPLKATVSFHGGLSTGPEGEAQAIRGGVLVLTGAADPMVPDSDVVALEDEFRAVPDLDWQVVSYAGAMHAFAVPGADQPAHGVQYQERADRRSWTAMKDLFAEVL